MRNFNIVITTTALFLAAAFGLSIGSEPSWWGVVNILLHGWAVGWAILTLLALTILRLDARRRNLRVWLRRALTWLTPAGLVLALALGGEWGLMVMIVVETAIIVVAIQPLQANRAPTGAWRQKMKGLFIQPPTP